MEMRDFNIHFDILYGCQRFEYISAQQKIQYNTILFSVCVHSLLNTIANTHSIDLCALLVHNRQIQYMSVSISNSSTVASVIYEVRKLIDANQTGIIMPRHLFNMRTHNPHSTAPATVSAYCVPSKHMHVIYIKSFNLGK